MKTNIMAAGAAGVSTMLKASASSVLPLLLLALLSLVWNANFGLCGRLQPLPPVAAAAAITATSAGNGDGEGVTTSVGIYPPTCKRIECPPYDIIEIGDGYEIRRYNSSSAPVWMSTSPIQDISLVQATRTGFLQLFDYIQGKNSYDEKIEMTAPVISQVSASDGPFCESSFTVSFYVPKKNQPNPPPAEGLHVQRWTAGTYIAVRQFPGFVTDSNVGEEAAALQSSLAGTPWAAAIEESRRAHIDETATSYTVAQYNSPFEFDNRVNEIWMLFLLEGKSSPQRQQAL